MNSKYEMPLCSVLLPTWRRRESCHRCIRSIGECTKDKGRVEIILRVQMNDPESIAAIPEFLSLYPLMRVVVGLSYLGYGDLSRYYQDCADIAHGKWVWVMNDDVVAECPDWDEKLSVEPLDAIIMPEMHQLGGSGYPRDMNNPFMWVPNKSWEECGQREFSCPFDASLWTLLRNNGYPTRFMAGASVHHDRNPELIQRERA